MTPINMPPIEPYPADATYEERQALFQQWQDRFVKSNPDYFRPDGTQRTALEVLDILSR